MTTIIRNGEAGTAMGAYPANQVSDAEITAIYNYFKKTTATPPPETDNYSLQDIGLLSPEKTLRKAAWLLAKRLPTNAEMQAVQDHGVEGLDTALNSILQSDTANNTLTDYYMDELKVSTNTSTVVYYSRGFSLNSVVTNSNIGLTH